jgi:hypothetical protein
MWCSVYNGTQSCPIKSGKQSKRVLADKKFLCANFLGSTYAPCGVAVCMILLLYSCEDRKGSAGSKILCCKKCTPSTFLIWVVIVTHPIFLEKKIWEIWEKRREETNSKNYLLIKHLYSPDPLSKNKLSLLPTFSKKSQAWCWLDFWNCVLCVFMLHETV